MPSKSCRTVQTYLSLLTASLKGFRHDPRPVRIRLHLRLTRGGGTPDHGDIMNVDRQTHVAEIERTAAERAMKDAAKTRTPGDDIADEIRKAALHLQILAGLADMRFAVGERRQKEEAAAFTAYVAELARPLDEMFRRLLRLGADNVGAFSPLSQDECERSRIV